MFGTSTTDCLIEGYRLIQVWLYILFFTFNFQLFISIKVLLKHSNCCEEHSRLLKESSLSFNLWSGMVILRLTRSYMSVFVRTLFIMSPRLNTILNGNARHSASNMLRRHLRKHTNKLGLVDFSSLSYKNGYSKTALQKKWRPQVSCSCLLNELEIPWNATKISWD